MRASTRQDRTGSPADDLASPQHRAGRSTLTEELDGDDGAAQAKPMFDGAQRWETIDPAGDEHDDNDDGGGEGDEAHEQVQLAHLDAAPSEGAEHAELAVGAPSETLEAPAAAAPPQPAPDEGGGEMMLSAPDDEHGDDHADAEHGDADHDEDAAEAADEGGGDRALAAAPAATADHDEDEDAGEAAAGTRATASAASAGPAAPSGGTPKKPKKPKPHIRGERFTDKPKKNYFAKQDKLNKKSVKSNRIDRKHKKIGKNQISRPGVRVHQRDSFRLATSPAARYKIASGDQLEQIDQIDNGLIKAGHRLAINPAHSRKLKLPGATTPTVCVFVWVGSYGPGWMPVDFIKGDTADIKAAVEKHAKRWLPGKADRKDVKAAKQYVFIDAKAPTNDDDKLADAREREDRFTFILPGQKPSKGKPHGGGNHTSDYLGHFGRPNRMGGKRDYFNVTMNLPSKHAPPVAVDTTKPGDLFFIPAGHEYRREVAIYALRARKSRRRQVWVYGYIAKQGPTGPIPDDKRRGWVPLRVIRKV